MSNKNIQLMKDLIGQIYQSLNDDNIITIARKDWIISTFKYCTFLFEGIRVPEFKEEDKIVSTLPDNMDIKNKLETMTYAEFGKYAKKYEITKHRFADFGPSNGIIIRNLLKKGIFTIQQLVAASPESIIGKGLAKGSLIFIQKYLLGYYEGSVPEHWLYWRVTNSNSIYYDEDNDQT